MDTTPSLVAEPAPSPPAALWSFGGQATPPQPVAAPQDAPSSEGGVLSLLAPQQAKEPSTVDLDAALSQLLEGADPNTKKIGPLLGAAMKERRTLATQVKDLEAKLAKGADPKAFERLHLLEQRAELLGNEHFVQELHQSISAFEDAATELGVDQETIGRAKAASDLKGLLAAAKSVQDEDARSLFIAEGRKALEANKRYGEAMKNPAEVLAQARSAMAAKQGSMSLQASAQSVALHRASVPAYIQEAAEAAPWMAELLNTQDSQVALGSIEAMLGGNAPITDPTMLNKALISHAVLPQLLKLVGAAHQQLQDMRRHVGMLNSSQPGSSASLGGGGQAQGGHLWGLSASSPGGAFLKNVN